MVENIVERAARKLYATRGQHYGFHIPWEDVGDHRRELYVSEARAAILEHLQAMREVTPKALAAAWAEITKDKQRAGIARLGPGPGASDWWRAMIDAAIKELEEAG